MVKRPESGHPRSLPNDGGDEVLATKYFVEDKAGSVLLAIVEM